MLKVEILTIGGYFFEQFDDLWFFDNLSGLVIFHLDRSKVEILEEKAQSIDGQV